MAHKPNESYTVSVIIPTYKEALNLPHLLQRIAAVREKQGLEIEVVIMDDDSQDGTDKAIDAFNQDWVRLVVRKKNRGLSAAVLDGFAIATKHVILVMDADLSHPPETIPDMLAALQAGADFVIGSRYVQGGSTEEGWGWLRWINSKIATWLARPFTRIKDPMSGFFAFRRSLLENAPPLNPIGYKIGLEILVKCRCQKVREIPILFHKRFAGQSKLSLREQLRYLEHLRRLAEFKYGDWSRLLQFLAVGFSGTFVNLAALTVFIFWDLPIRLSVALAIFIAMLSNFILNRHFTFSYAKHRNWATQLVGFIAASSFGAIVNYAVTLYLLCISPLMERVPQLAAACGILAGLILNYTASRYLVFKK